jgi:signal transduction histidine kinase/HPt (histidine-containing phosphotransfer) domain-containing protein
VTTEDGANRSDAREETLLDGRVAILFALCDHHLFLPFAALCMVVSLPQAATSLFLSAAPLPFLIVASVVRNRLSRAYQNRGAEISSALWARRYTVLSAVEGLIWGLGALVWFVPGSFPAQAYLVLAFLGMSATEFIARAAYPRAYLVHALMSLLPLAVLLVSEGGVYQGLSAVLLVTFGGTLYSYSAKVAELLDESILLRHDNVRLIGRLSEEKHAAETVRDTAQASERAKSDFIANISHELRTPLNAVLGMAQLLERSDLVKTQRDHVKVLLEAGRGLKTLLDDIIVLSQQDESLSSPEEGCDAAQAARTVARLLQPNAWEKRLRLSLNIAPVLPHVAADPRLLRRVLLKLVGNAIKFTERGNIEISLDTIEDEPGGRRVRLAVTDTGPGIPHHLLTTIFAPFTKEDNSYTARHTGAGVGLAVAKRLVESIGGTIDVESEPGMGARFWITIPVVPEQVAEDSQTESVAPPNGLSILMYLPDEEIRHPIERLLSPFGNTITSPETLAQATTISARGGFAVIIAPAASVDVLAATPGQKTPILALVTTAERHPDGADAVLRWPATPNALFSAITSLTVYSPKSANESAEDSLDAAIDGKAINELEKSLGVKTLIDILQSYLSTAEGMAEALTAASGKEDWSQAGRLAQDFAGAAGGLGLSALTSAARSLAQNARDGAGDNALSSAAQSVLTEHKRVREALCRLYPDLAA